MKEAVIFDIQRFSLHDGPGIRTLFFFKGCSLACNWCSNPEGIRFEPEIRNDTRHCISCGKCMEVCPLQAIQKDVEGVSIDRGVCDKCGLCTEVCPSKALSWWGKRYSVEELFELAKRDKPFYESSGGGITLGGGDPLLQKDAAVALLKLCQEKGINTSIETAGNYPWENLEEIAPFCNIIHFDLKGWDRSRHVQNTGVDNNRIIDNLVKLDKFIADHRSSAKLIIRTVILPGQNYTTDDYRQLGVFLADLKSVDKIEILPFHNLGENKYRQLDRSYILKGSHNLKLDEIEAYRQIMKEVGLNVKVSSI